MRYLTLSGAKRHRFDDGSDPPSQPSKFLGRCTAEFSTEKSWLNKKPAVIKQLLRVLESADANEITKLENLPSIKPGKMGRGLFIKNPQNFYNPQKFYMLLENGNYAFENPQWIKYFPAFESSLEAHRDMHFLLGNLHKMHLIMNQKMQGSQPREDTQSSFIRGQLVLVKCKKEWPEKSDTGFAYEIRRGFVENISQESGTSPFLIYSVYLLDYGFHVEVTANFLHPLLRPFDSIAPLAVQCSLYGVSPIGVKWCYRAREAFSNLLQNYADHIFIVDCLSNHRFSPMPLIVNIDVCDFQARIIQEQRKIRIRFQHNLTQFMIDTKQGAQWNLFPSRPKLMAGATPTSPEAVFGPQKLSRITVSYRDALLIAPVALPVVHKRLPLKVISRELKKLFRLRHNYLVDVFGTSNYLAVRVPDPDRIFSTPSTIDSTRSNGNDEEGGRVTILRMLK